MNKVFDWMTDNGVLMLIICIAVCFVTILVNIVILDVIDPKDADVFSLAIIMLSLFFGFIFFITAIAKSLWKD